jgi:hypothetical protein
MDKYQNKKGVSRLLFQVRVKIARMMLPEYVAVIHRGTLRVRFERLGIWGLSAKGWIEDNEY